MRTILVPISMILLTMSCGAAQNLPPESECNRGLKESDLVAGGWQGPGVQADGGLPATDAVVSTTFLALEPDATTQALFRSLFAPIGTDLTTRDGLVAYQVFTSGRCMTARTISVWKDQASMYTFVGGTAHAAAVAKIGTLSRGGTAVTHWSARASDVTLDDSINRIGAVDAPF